VLQRFALVMFPPCMMQSSDEGVAEASGASDPPDAWKYAFPRPGQTKADTKLPHDFRSKMHLNGPQSARSQVPGTLPFPVQEGQPADW